jgi:S-adenosylmethionine decarboxylase
MIVGTEWIIDAEGCDAGLLRDVELLREILERVIAELDLKVVGEMMWHRFPFPHGVTGVAMLSESHLACHTYPEYEIATFNLYCCRERPRWNWEEVLSETLKAKNVSVRMIERAVVDLQIKMVGGEQG